MNDAISTVKLPVHALYDNEDAPETVTRWSPCGKYIVHLTTEDLAYERGVAHVLSATSGEAVAHFAINCHRLWPQWMPWSSSDSATPQSDMGLVASRTPAADLKCFLPDSKKLFSVQPDSPLPVSAAAHSHWTQVSGATSPRCQGILVTLLVKDGPLQPAASSACRQPGALETWGGFPHSFSHKRLGSVGIHAATGQVEIASHARDQNFISTRECPLQGHPFVMAWLHGMDTYAAAAFGHIWLIDGFHDVRLAFWRANDPSMAPVHALGKIKRRGHTRHSPARGEPWGCVAMSFSPDLSCLAWVKSGTWLSSALQTSSLMRMLPPQQRSHYLSQALFILQGGKASALQFASRAQHSQCFGGFQRKQASRQLTVITQHSPSEVVPFQK